MVLCKLNGAKIARNVEKYFQCQFWKVRHTQNIIKLHKMKEEIKHMKIKTNLFYSN